MTDRIARRELIWVALGQMFTLLLGIATLKALTSLLGPEDYGRFALGLTVAGALNLFIYGPISHAVARYIHLCPQHDIAMALDRVVAFVLRWCSTVVIAVGIVAALATGLSLGVAWGVLLSITVAYGVSSGVIAILLADMNTRRRRRGYAVLQSADALLRLIAAALLVSVTGAAGTAAMTGFLLGSLAALVLGKFVLKSHTPAFGKVTGLFAKGQLGWGFGKYVLSISVFAVPAILASYGDRWIIQHSLSEAHVGVYVALAQIANAPANLMLAVFSQTLNPIIFQRAGSAGPDEAMHSGRRLLYRALFLLSILLASVTLGSYVFGEWIVRLLTSPGFVPYANLLWVLVLAAALFQAGQALASEAFLYNKPFLLFLPKLAHAVIFLGLSFWLVTSRQLEGVAIAAVVGAAVYLPLVMRVNARAARAHGSASAVLREAT